jgi:dolichol-phosphate mannosyltransferase
LAKRLKPAAIIHAAAQPSHDLAAVIPFDDFDINAVGTMNMLEAARQFCPEAPFIHMSTNKVYGDLPNSLALAELESRWDFSDPAYMTWEILLKLAKEILPLKPVQNSERHGFGRAIIHGFDRMAGDACVVMMADESDDCRDVVRYWNELCSGIDCVFGSRFMRGGGPVDYPTLKLLLNRLANTFLRILFGIAYNDTTNAFKAYRREVIDGCRPLISPHFNLTVELPLKSIVRGYSWKVISITWRNRKAGIGKCRIKEMGSRYLFICLYIWLEKHLSRGDYCKK